MRSLKGALSGLAHCIVLLLVATSFADEKTFDMGRTLLVAVGLLLMIDVTLIVRNFLSGDWEDD